MTTPDDPDRPRDREEREGRRAARGIIYGVLFSLVAIGLIVAAIVVAVDLLG
ncbi:hypothetical protein ACH3VR_16255 [Microbacterium sp. B2969]|uniref:Uncharacterized protein n=1 Tax=Microbacterium alkaliflavum TaxID=3248839 RepID=A0ABW7QAL0_9MICO